MLSNSEVRAVFEKRVTQMNSGPPWKREAKIAEIYKTRWYAVQFHADGSSNSDRKGPRRHFCVAERPGDSVWTGLARITTGIRPEDLPSPEDPTLKLTKEGAWSLRFIMSVSKELTGHPNYCNYLSQMSGPQREEVLNFYRGRRKRMFKEDKYRGGRVTQ